MDCTQREFRQAVLEGHLHEVQFPVSDRGEEIIEENTEVEPRGDVFQDSPGILNQPEESAPVNFDTTGRSIEMVNISEINRVILIKDFSLRTAAGRPLLVRDPDGYHCMDGWDLIIEARNSGLDQILCEIDTVDSHSELELMIRKAAMRTATRGGQLLFAEGMRNIRDIYNYCMESNANLINHDHGGCRRGEGYIGDPENDIRHLISVRLGFNRDTVNAYINYAEYNSDEVLDYFINAEAKKKFFESAQKDKRKLIRRLEGLSLSKEEITQRVSTFMRETFEANLGESRRTEGDRTLTPCEIDAIVVSEPEDSDNQHLGFEEDVEFLDVENEESIWECIDNIEEDTGEEDDQDVCSNESGDFITSVNIAANGIQNEAEDDPVIISEIREAALEIARRLTVNLTNSADLKDLNNYLSRESSNLLALSDRVREIIRQN